MRAAMRRGWSSDPVIRDFIGLSENWWDFNALDGVPGFGSLTPEDIQRLAHAVQGAGAAGEAMPMSAAATSSTEAAQTIESTPILERLQTGLDTQEKRPSDPDAQQHHPDSEPFACPARTAPPTHPSPHAPHPHPPSPPRHPAPP